MPKIFTKSHLVFYIASLFLICIAFRTAPQYFGDGTDYIYTLQAWFDHHSPDIRAEDITYANTILAQNKIHVTATMVSLVHARYGKEFSLHFWMYSLFALPAKYVLYWFKGNELSAFFVTNTLLLIAASFIGLFSKSCRDKQFYFVGLATIGPTLGYLIWTSSEIFSWAFVLMALALLENRKYCAASVCAGIAATQNSPIVFLVIYCILASLREKDRKLTLLSLSGFIVALLPTFFYYGYYGFPNLIAATGNVNIHLISVARTISFFTDLNQGMLVYVPILVFFFPIAAIILLYTRNWSQAGAVLMLLCMVLSVETTTNWNSGAAGMMRYALWMVPIMAWITLTVLPMNQVWKRILLLAILIQVDLAAPHLQGTDDHLAMSPLACWFLTNAPVLYNPDPEIFVERLTNKEPKPTETYSSLPVGFIIGNGVVTKILVTKETLNLLSLRYQMNKTTEAYIVRHNAGQSGLFYINPPLGAVRAINKNQLY